MTKDYQGIYLQRLAEVREGLAAVEAAEGPLELQNAMRLKRLAERLSDAATNVLLQQGQRDLIDEVHWER